MVIYDVPIRMEDDHLIEAFKSKSKQITSAARLNWTLGDISLTAWKLVGPNLKELSGSIIRDPQRKRPMYMITMQHCAEERATHSQKVQSMP